MMPTEITTLIGWKGFLLFMYLLCFLHMNPAFLFIFLKILFIFRGRGREEEREGEKHQWVAASDAPPTGDLARKPGMGPDWELN